MNQHVWAALDAQQKTTALKAVWERGVSASELADRVSKSLQCEVGRSAVLGIYNRSRDALSDHPLLPVGTNRFDAMVKPELEKVEIEPDEYDLVSRRVSLLDLEAGECNWPVEGEGVSTLFCGHAAGRHSYCRHHLLRSIGIGSLSERNAIKDAERIAG